MHEALVLRGGPTYPKAWPDLYKEWGIQGWVWESHRPDGELNEQIGGAFLDKMRNPKPGITFKVRILTDPKWWNHTLSPTSLAQKISDAVGILESDHKQLALMPDIEIKDPDFILATLVELHRLRPGRGICWTLEGNQAGPGSWLRAAKPLIEFINSEPLLSVAPQSYAGDMTPWPADEMRVQMWDAGFKRDKVDVFYSNELKLEDKQRWSGYWYDWINSV